MLGGRHVLSISSANRIMKRPSTPRKTPLEGYRSKRDFARTPEPAGRSAPAQGPAPRFVVQEHHARRLHWDLRLEHDGVAASWAVPKGIPMDPKGDVLAVHTEDHPLSYLEFAGEIPRGEYGAGTMRIWDHGTYEPEKFRDDEVIATFHGERMSGRYALFRTRGENWMLHRMDPPADPGAVPMPERIDPMQARLAAFPRGQDGWAFEVKWDGVRAIAFVEGGRVRLQSRSGRDITARYPEIGGLGRSLGSRAVVLDGEVVAFDPDGRPDFGRLQGRMHLASDAAVRRRARETPVAYVIFDLLWLEGHSLMALPYDERRARLEQLGLAGPAWQAPPAQLDDGEALLAASRELGLEGIVAKRRGSPYEPGRRSPCWVKVKNVHRQDFVVGGWMPGEGGRSGRVGALLVGYHDDEGALRYAGRVGSGFTEAELRRVGDLLEPLATDRSPFIGRQPPKASRFVAPELVAEVEFREWTHSGTLRAPAYKGMREDADPRDAVREAIDAPPPAEELARSQPASPRPAAEGEGGRRGSAAAEGGSAAGDAADAIAAARPRRGATRVEVEIDGRTLSLSNLDKVLYPEAGFTKGDVIDYYARIAPVLLPHLRDRPLTLKRYPNGVQAAFFYEKQCPRHRPDWIRTERVGDIDYCLVDELATVVWLANLADLEIHPSLSRVPVVQRPTVMAFDLDPGEPAALLECCRVAVWLREVFDALGLECFAKTSGSKGLQVYVPLNVETTYAETKPFAQGLATLLEKQHSELVVSRQTKWLRKGKVLVDWSQNDEHKTTVCVWSLRARERPTVSTPLRWEEVAQALEAGDAQRLVFDAPAALARAGDGDLFAPVESLEQHLPDLRGAS
jgi:bifunctional non-homologous end joining protein LigD